MIDHGLQHVGETLPPQSLHARTFRRVELRQDRDAQRNQRGPPDAETQHVVFEQHVIGVRLGGGIQGYQLVVVQLQNFCMAEN